MLPSLSLTHIWSERSVLVFCVKHTLLTWKDFRTTLLFKSHSYFQRQKNTFEYLRLFFCFTFNCPYNAHFLNLNVTLPLGLNECVNVGGMDWCHIQCAFPAHSGFPIITWLVKIYKWMDVWYSLCSEHIQWTGNHLVLLDRLSKLCLLKVTSKWLL